MALSDEVQNRYSSQYLVSVSNPQNSIATTIDTTRLNNAVSDVTATFKKYGITYDNSDDRHVATAVPGVVARLLLMTGQDDGRQAWQGFMDDLDLLSKTTSRNRITPTTDSTLNPTKETASSKPSFDRSIFDRYVGNAPGGQEPGNPIGE